MFRWLILVVLLAGCAAKKKPEQKLVIPVECIRKVQLKATKCTLLPDGRKADCQHVIIDAGCLKAVAK